MDEFDDLLNPSRNNYDDNPFNNPFAQHRSSSPDPWATYTAQPQPFSDDLSPQAEPFESLETHESEDEEEDEERSDAPAPAQPESLDVEVLSHGEPDGDASIATRPTPGFREDVQEEVDANEHPQLTASGVTPISTDDHALLTSERPVLIARKSTPPASRIRESTLGATLDDTHLGAGHAEGGRVVVSPLDPPAAPPVLHNSFASLSLGGETVGGWPGSQTQSTFVKDNVSESVRDQSEPSSPVAEATDTQKDSKGAESSEPRAEFVIAVHDPQKVGDPIRSFTMYTVHTRTNSPLYPKSSFSVLRRYSDFLWLYEILSANNPGVVVPPVPEKNPFGRFENQFIEQRRASLEKCIQKIANHPVLAKDLDLKMFLESDSFALDIKHRKAELAHERGGLMASIGQSIAGPKFYENDEWFDKQKTYLDHLEAQLRSLVKSIDIVSKQRAELAMVIGEFAQTIADLAGSELSQQLSHSLAVMSDVEKNAQDLQQVQSLDDVSTILSTVDEYARLINSVRLAFASRIRVYTNWQLAEGEVRRVKQAHERSRSQGRLPTYALSQLAESERRATEAKHEFMQVSRLVKAETARFERERVEDFKRSLEQFLEGMISRQREVIAAWENFQELLLKKVAASNRTSTSQLQLVSPAPAS